MNTDEDLIKHAYPKAPQFAINKVQALCAANGLNATLRPYVIKSGGDILLSAAGYAMLAHNTGQYAGKDPIDFGDWFNMTFQGKEYCVPAEATVTVYRILDSIRCAFSHTVQFSEYASCRAHFAYPVMFLQKWATAQALRDAFTDVIGAHVSSEEMQANMDFSDRKTPLATDMDFSTTGKKSTLPSKPEVSTKPSTGPALMQELDAVLTIEAMKQSQTAKDDHAKLIAELFG